MTPGGTLRGGALAKGSGRVELHEGGRLPQEFGGLGIGTNAVTGSSVRGVPARTARTADRTRLFS